MEQKSPVDVVIVNYNAGDILLDTVAAVCQSSQPVNLFIVDNASDKGQWARLRSKLEAYGPVFIENQENLGFAAANNQALAKTTSDYILLLNPDCVVQSETLQRVIETLEQYPKAGMAGCRILNEDGTEQRGCRRNLPTIGSGFGRAFNLKKQQSAGKAIDLNAQPLPDKPVYVEAISGAFMLVCRPAFEDVGGLDEAYFLHCEDLDWCKRFADSGWKILFVPDVEITHHQGSCSKSSPISVSWHKHRGMARYYDGYLASQHSKPFNLFVYAGIYGRFFALTLVSSFKRLFSSHGK